jgi:hypothetical protein
MNSFTGIQENELFDSENITEQVAIKYFNYKKGPKKETYRTLFPKPLMDLEVFKSIINLFKTELQINLKIYIGVLQSILYYREGNFGVRVNGISPMYTFYTNTNIIINLSIRQYADGLGYDMSCSFGDKNYNILTYNTGMSGRGIVIHENIILNLKIDKNNIIDKIVYLPRIISDYLMICDDNIIVNTINQNKTIDADDELLNKQINDRCLQLEKQNLDLKHQITDILNKFQVETQKNVDINSAFNILKDKYIVLLEKLEMEKNKNNKLNNKMNSFTHKTSKNVNSNIEFLKSTLNNSLNSVFKHNLTEDSDDESSYENENIYIRVREKH